ncbi:MAG: DEAD/DEAH box helicase [Nanoarchaeota archaeon]
MEQIKFENLNLSKETLSVISQKGFKIPTQVQEKIIPIIFEQKYDIIGIAQTGTGKTGAFGLPLIDLINAKNKIPKAIILAPTRELALQVSSELEIFSAKKKLKILTVYGGSPITNQIRSLERGIDIVVGTPGRVVDLLKRKKLILNDAKYFILDEADEMLKMGFIEDIEFVLKSSAKEKKVYLFSATMPQRIKTLSKKYMKNQKIIEIANEQKINNLIEHSFYVAKQSDKFDTLSTIIDIDNFFYGIIFCRTKVDVEKVASALRKTKHNVDFIHGDIMQNKRERILKKFKEQRLNILVATDVAARGIDVENLSHIINYNLPDDIETYTHRVGRTGRAGNKGKAISLVTPAESRKISLIEKTLKVKLQKSNLPSQKELDIKKEKRFNEEIENIILKNSSNQYTQLTKKLLEQHDSSKIINALLEKLENKNNNISDKNNTTKKNKTSNKNVRLFIAKGQIDKINEKSLIKFLERNTNSKLTSLQDIKVCDKFSFITANQEEADIIIESFETNSRRKPIVEVAKN